MGKTIEAHLKLTADQADELEKLLRHRVKGLNRILDDEFAEQKYTEDYLVRWKNARDDLQCLLDQLGWWI